MRIIGSLHLTTRNKKDIMLYSNKMYVNCPRYLVIATMALVATMVLPLSYAQLESPESLLVKVTGKSWKTISVVKIENNKDNIYDINLVWLTLQNGVIQSFKSVDGWSSETASNPNTVQFRTDSKPIQPGESVRFGIKSDQTSPIFKWIILDEDGDELGSGILDVAKQMQENVQPSTSNGKPQETNPRPEDNPVVDGNEPEVSDVPKTPSVPPVIYILPEVAKPGFVVRISGEGFTPNSKLNVLFDGRSITRLDISTEGTLRDRVTIPKDTVNGAHQISVSDTTGRAANISITVKEDERIVQLTVITEQQSYRQGDLVKITGTGKAGAAVQLTANNPVGIAILSLAVPVDSSGKYSAFIPLSQDATPGNYEIAAFQDAKTVKIAFKVETISGQPISVVTDKFEYKQGENVKISGKTSPNKDVDVRVFSPDGSEAFQNVVRSDSNGGYEVSMPVSPTSALGKYSAVVEVDNEEISITFTIIQGSVTLTIQTDKEEYREGELVRISGKGKANERVSIQIKTPREELIPMSTNTKSDGSFSALWLVPATAKNGTYRLFVEQGDARAETLFVVST